ncbi:MAG: 30S ribosomal protein S4 [Nitrospinota bacterium]|nr:MAG: 30S ribosomal protein S4 [Nitrospinota bacterium]
MARYRGSVCRLCRRENMKLFLKGERCLGEKCAISRRNYAPGEHGQRRPKPTEYGLQLREKQKVKRIYGILERQFRNYFDRAERVKGITGEQLLILLERRLDNVVHRLGFATSRAQARQLVRHSHFLVNGRKVNIPSYLVNPGDVIEVKEKSRNLVPILNALEAVEQRGIPPWLELDKPNFRGIVHALPDRESITIPINEQLVVELYSK